MFGAKKMFERQFTPCEGGYLFYPFAWSRGYLVTEAEFRKLCHDRDRSLSFIGMLKWLLPLMLVVTVVSATPAILLEDERFLTAGNVVLVLVVLTVILWKSMAATRLIRGREPIAPRRSKV